MQLLFFFFVIKKEYSIDSSKVCVYRPANSTSSFIPFTNNKLLHLGKVLSVFILVLLLFLVFKGFLKHRMTFSGHRDYLAALGAC